jgi:transposase
MNHPHLFDLVIGLGRSDRTADVYLIDPRTDVRAHQSIPTAPEGLRRWAAQPQARVALCLEQPALNLIACLETYPWLVLYPINLQNYRQALVTSRAKDDAKDARYLAEWLFHHHAELHPWTPEDRRTRLLQQLVAHRRAVVDERTALTNRLQALAQAVLSAGPGAVRRGAVATAGHGVAVEMAEPAGVAAGAPGLPEAVLLPARLAQRQAGAAAAGADRPGRGVDRGRSAGGKLRLAGATGGAPTPAVGVNGPTL